MTDIIGHIEVRKIGAKQFLLLAGVVITLNDGFEIWIPKGFIYDGGSLPPFMYTTMGCPFGTRGDYGYLGHDYLYFLARTGQPICSRKYADRAMLEIHKHRGVHSIRAHPIYHAVRIFASHKWEEK